MLWLTLHTELAEENSFINAILFATAENNDMSGRV